MAFSLLALLDDITSMLDDVALLTKVAAKTTSGVIGDDLALNAEQAAGVRVDRELPVVWAVAKGSFVNKLILVPAALVISAFAPWAVMPLMMIGGLYLCFEGVEKLAHKFLHKHDHEDEKKLPTLATDMSDAERVAFESAKIKGAVRTDFVLSAEIIVISLGTMSTAPMPQQVFALSLVSVAATVLVYGLVAGIVKLDDLGLALHRRGNPLGNMILRTAPWLMKALAVGGTAAMFTVGGGILAHGVHSIDAVLENIAHATGPAAMLVKTVLDAFLGIAAGAILLLGLTLVRKRK